jgi:hypothetical protein
VARARARAPLIDAAGVVAATVGLLVITLRLWEANLRVPFVYNAKDRSPLAYAPDAPYYLMVTKGLVEHDAYLRIPNLGWPFSLQLYDNPETGDNLRLGLLDPRRGRPLQCSTSPSVRARFPSHSGSLGGSGDEDKFADDFTSAKHLVRLCCL